jgi:predicted RNA-binding Zn ribbon-like protein
MSQAASVFYKHGFGKVAPWVDLTNSEEWDGFGKFTDHLSNPRWLHSFLKHWKFDPLPAKHIPRLDLLQLRRVLRRTAEELAAGQPPNPAHLSKLNHALNVPVRQRLVQNQNGLRTELLPVKKDWRWVMARIAASLGEMLASQQAERIRICANSDCRWIFYDPTKARIKRWCKDRTCGNRARVRRSRALQK